MNVADGTLRRASAICVAEMSTPVRSPTVGERAVIGMPGAAAQLEDVGAGGISSSGEVEEREPRGRRSQGAPREIALGDRVVAGGDDPLRDPSRGHVGPACSPTRSSTGWIVAVDDPERAERRLVGSASETRMYRASG